jgi:serine/threonine-protein kinase
VNTSLDGSERNPVEALAEEFLDRQRRGERPTMEEYCLRHPEIAADIRDLFPVLLRMEDLGADSSAASAGGPGPAGPTQPRRLGDFRILREVGRGGMGVVYEAEQESLGRRVALKVLPEAALADRRHVLRFQREARAAARLHHTNIVPVFGVGQEAGSHYYVMQFIPGMGLDAVLQELRRLRRGTAAGPEPGRHSAGAAAVAEAILTGRFSLTDGGGADHGLAPTATVTFDDPRAAPPDPGLSSVSLPGAPAESLTGSDPDRTSFRSVASIGRQVAEALEYANRQGVLHRDVKPSNLLLDPRGNVWVADFGLAKAGEADDLTHTGDIIGTVRYMAPERFTGRCDARSDVYSLGLTLYEVLALRPAYEASDRHTLIRQVMSEPPEPLRKLVPHLPRDLETIVQKAIDRDPARRYPSAAALAEDLQRFLDDKPIRARRVTAAEQAWRWARRNPAVAALASGLLLALVGGLAGVTWQWRRAAAHLQLAEAANRKAEARFGLAMAAVQAFTTGASEDVLLREKQLTALRNKLLEGSLTFYDRLAASLEGETDRASRRSLARAMYEAAELKGRIGRREQALAAHRQALALRAALSKEAPGDAEAGWELGRSELAVGEMLVAMGRQAEARQAFARSRAVAEVLARARPDDADARALLADGTAAEGHSLLDEHRLWDARPLLERAREIYDELVRAAGTTDAPERYRRGRARCAFELGQWGGWYGRWPGDLAALEQATADYEALVRQSPGDVDLWLALAGCHMTTADYLQNFVDNPYPGVRRHIRRAKAVYERLAREYPTATGIRAGWAWCLNLDANLPRPDATRGEWEDYVREIGLSVAMARGVVAADPDVPKYLATLGPGLYEYGRALFEAGRPEEGLAYLKEACDVLERRDFTGTFSFQQGRFQQSRARLVLAAFLAMAGRAGEALEAVRMAVARDNAYTGPREAYNYANTTAQIHLLHSHLAFGAGERTEAAEAADRAAALLEALPEPLPQETWDLGTLHLIWYMQGRRAAAGRAAEPPGRPEHAAQAVALVRRAADRGFINLPVTAAFFGPVLGHLPDYQRLMMDLPFPGDPFMPLPDAPDVGPLPPAGADR